MAEKVWRCVVHGPEWSEERIQRAGTAVDAKVLVEESYRAAGFVDVLVSVHPEPVEEEAPPPRDILGDLLAEVRATIRFVAELADRLESGDGLTSLALLCRNRAAALGRVLDAAGVGDVRKPASWNQKTLRYEPAAADFEIKGLRSLCFFLGMAGAKGEAGTEELRCGLSERGVEPAWLSVNERRLAAGGRGGSHVLRFPFTPSAFDAWVEKLRGDG